VPEAVPERATVAPGASPAASRAVVSGLASVRGFWTVAGVLGGAPITKVPEPLHAKTAAKSVARIRTLISAIEAPPATRRASTMPSALARASMTTAQVAPWTRTAGQSEALSKNTPPAAPARVGTTPVASTNPWFCRTKVPVARRGSGVRLGRPTWRSPRDRSRPA
jgi:hypothetical protein